MTQIHPIRIGNPFVLGRDGDRARVMITYRVWLQAQLAAGPGNRAHDKLQQLMRLARQRPLRLMCYCTPLACHGMIIAEVLGDLARGAAR